MVTYIARVITCQKLSNLSIKIPGFTACLKSICVGYSLILIPTELIETIQTVIIQVFYHIDY